MRERPLILVVDDVPDNVEILQMRLEAQGYEVVTAGDGVEALEKTRELLPDLLLLDIMMPKMDGIAVVKELKATPPCRSSRSSSSPPRPTPPTSSPASKAAATIT